MAILNVAVPTLRWSPSQDAEEYDVVIYDKFGNPETDATSTSALSWTPPESSS